MSVENEDTQIDLSEKGRARDGTPIKLNRRLFMQFHAFGNCRDTTPLIEAMERSKIDGALYLDINDPMGVGLISMEEEPDLFITKTRDLLLQPPFQGLTFKPEYTMLGRTYSFGYEPDLESTLINEPRRRVLGFALPAYC